MLKEADVDYIIKNLPNYEVSQKEKSLKEIVGIISGNTSYLKNLELKDLAFYINNLEELLELDENKIMLNISELTKAKCVRRAI